MYTMIQSAGVRSVLVKETLPLASSLIIAQLFYKFGAFLPELAAFAITWFLLSAAQAHLLKLRS